MIVACETRGAHNPEGMAVFDGKYHPFGVEDKPSSNLQSVHPFGVVENDYEFFKPV